MPCDHFISRPITDLSARQSNITFVMDKILINQEPTDMADSKVNLHPNVRPCQTKVLTHLCLALNEKHDKIDIINCHV
jgi:hypothetical protein